MDAVPAGRGRNNPIGKKWSIGSGERKLLHFGGEHGEAGRTFNSAIDIQTTESHPYLLNSDSHNSHNFIDEWSGQLNQAHQETKKQSSNGQKY